MTKLFKEVEITDNEGNRPVKVMSEAFECPSCNELISYEEDNWIELDDGHEVCESCWRNELPECGICGETFLPEDEYTLICDKCKKEIVE